MNYIENEFYSVPSDEEWDKRDLALYNSDKKEWLASMGIDDKCDGVIVGGIQVDIFSNDSVDVVAMKVENAIEGKEYIVTEYTSSIQKKIEVNG